MSYNFASTTFGVPRGTLKDCVKKDEKAHKIKTKRHQKICNYKQQP